MNCIKPMEMHGRVVPCGKCNLCMKNRKNDWSFRLNWEAKYAKSSHFVTLTYNNENLPLEGATGHADVPTLKKEHLQQFMKSLRQSQQRWFSDQGLEQPDYPIKFYGVGEYGTRTQRPHYHVIIFNLHQSQVDRIGQIWNKGHVHVGSVTPASTAYTAKYIIDDDKRWMNQPIEKPFALMSKNLGLVYLDKNKRWHRCEEDEIKNWRMYVVSDAGLKQRMPRYFRDKLFSADEVEAFQLLNEFARSEEYVKNFNADFADYGVNTGILRRARTQQKNFEVNRKSKLKNKL